MGNKTDKVYYYHPDHLGSTNYITNASGKIHEHTEYFPFGESWASESQNTQANPKLIPYLFTGKELDVETQLYYYGARYYDPRTSVWQSPDPILGKYLSGKPNRGVRNSLNLNLYAYTAQSPINYVDPSGLAWKVKNKWSDKVSIADQNRALGTDSSYDKDVTYKELYQRWFSDKAKDKYYEKLSADCADFSMIALTDFAEDNNLPVKLYGSKYNKKGNAIKGSSQGYNQKNYKTKKTFLNAVKSGITALNLLMSKNTKSIGAADIKAGDIFNDGVHVGVFTGTPSQRNGKPTMIFSKVCKLMSRVLME